MAAPPTTTTTPSYAATAAKTAPKATNIGAAAKKLSDRQKKSAARKKSREENYDRDQHTEDISGALSAFLPYDPASEKKKKEEAKTPGQPTIVDMAEAFATQKNRRDMKELG